MYRAAGRLAQADKARPLDSPSSRGIRGLRTRSFLPVVAEGSSTGLVISPASARFSAVLISDVGKVVTSRSNGM